MLALGQSSGADTGAAQPAGPTLYPAPTPTPRADGAVVHIVQSGDSIWSLAANYADVMGITPQEALTAIPELNNNPAVLRSGMELIIVPPSEDGGQAADSSEETAEVVEVETEKHAQRRSMKSLNRQARRSRCLQILLWQKFCPRFRPHLFVFKYLKI